MESSKVEFLFENNTVVQIEEIHKKLKNEVESKKDDLKQIVGERYRDLIEASDTIRDMKTSCNNILNSINKLNAFCEDFSLSRSSQQKSGSNISEDADKKQEESDRYRDLMLAIKYKVIIKTPSAIWMALDKGDVLRGVYFYFQSKRIHENLKNEQKQIPPLINEYNLAVESFASVLLESCWNNLKTLTNEDTDENLIATHLNCILLLENLTISALYEQFMEKQMNDFLLSFDQRTDLQNIFCNILKIVFYSLRTSFLVFFDNSGAKSLLLRNMSSISKSSFIHEFLLSEKIKFIPDVVKNFKLKPLTYLDDITPIEIKMFVERFIENITNRGNFQILNSLKKINSATNIFQVLSRIDEFFKNGDRYQQWDEFCDAILNVNYPIWSTFLREPIMNSLKLLFESKLREAFKILIEKVKMVKNTDIDGFSLDAYIWQNESAYSDLKTKSFGVSILIKKFCEEFDRNMEQILNDAQIVGTTNANSKMMHEKDENELREHFFYVCKLLISDFSSEMKNMIQETEDESIFSFLSHLCRSLTQCCPHFKLCLGSSHDKSEEKWQAAKEELLLASFIGFQIYFENVFKKLFHDLDQNLDSNSLVLFVEKNLLWEETTFEDTIEDGKTVSSTVKIPVQLSLSLFSFLNAFVSEINSVSAHTLSKKVVTHCLISITKSIAELYTKKFLEITQYNTLPTIKQTFALQLYFDLLYLKQLLVNTRKENIKREAVSLIHETSVKFESLIDPFDLHVYLPKIQENLLRMGKRSSLIFGLLLPETTMVYPNTKSKDTQRSETHNLMPTYSLSNPFTLLPLSSRK